MPITNKALFLKRYRELKSIFKDHKNFNNMLHHGKKYPYHLTVTLWNQIEYDYIQKLKDCGWEFISIKTKQIEQKIQIELLVYKEPIEKEYTDYDYNFEDTDYAQISKKIQSQEYWRVKYELEKKELDWYQKHSWDQDKQIIDLKQQVTTLIKQIQKTQEVQK